MERLNNARAAGRLLLSAVGAVFPLPTLVSEVQPSDKRVQRRVGDPTLPITTCPAPPATALGSET